MALYPKKAYRKFESHQDVRRALRDVQTYSSDLQGDADVRDYRQIPLEVDAPMHHLYRNALSSYFVKPAIEKHFENFRLNARTALRSYFGFVTKDFIEEVSLKYVMQNLGLIYARPQDIEEWCSWGSDVWTAGGPVRDGTILHSYIDRVYEEALTKRYSDVWSDIASLEINGRQISRNEFKGISGVMLAGGRDTVIKMITGITWHLSKNPALFQELKQDRSLLQKAISEYLRFFTPLPSMVRTEYPESTTKELPENRYVEMSFISANFDPKVFADPFNVDFKRERNAHLSFGFGPHTCLGIHMAERQIWAYLEELLDFADGYLISKELIHFYGDNFPGVPAKFERLEIDVMN